MSADVIAPRNIARRERSGVFYGLTWSGITSVAVAVVAGFLVIRAGLSPALGLPLAAVAVTVGVVRLAGRPIIGWTPIIGVYFYRALTGKTQYRRELNKPRITGTLGLPGDAARLRLVVDEHGTAFVNDPHTRHFTATLRVTHGGTVLLDPTKQVEYDRGWARVLDAIARFDSNVARLQVIERTLPSGGGLLHEYLATKTGPLVDSQLAGVYESLVAKQSESLRHESLIAITMDLRKAASRVREMGGGITGAVNLTREVMHALQAAVPSAGLTADGWLTEADLALVIRSVYDPASIPRISTGTIGRGATTAGPMAVEETWSIVQTDSAHHQVFAVTEWPRMGVGVMSMWPLILTPGVQRTFAIVAKPISASTSRREARTKVSDSRIELNRRSSRRGWVDPEDEAEVKSAEKRLAEVALQGSREFEFIGLIVVSSPDRDTLRKEARKVLTQAQAADLELRPLVAQQAQHLVTAALPFGRGL